MRNRLKPINDVHSNGFIRFSRKWKFFTSMQCHFQLKYVDFHKAFRSFVFVPLFHFLVCFFFIFSFDLILTGKIVFVFIWFKYIILKSFAWMCDDELYVQNHEKTMRNLCSNNAMNSSLCRLFCKCERHESMCWT